MNELKTLKEICWKNEIGLSKYIEIRKESINWVKETIYRIGKDRGLSECRKLIEFMNLSSEDLK